MGEGRKHVSKQLRVITEKREESVQLEDFPFDSWNRKFGSA